MWGVWGIADKHAGLLLRNVKERDQLEDLDVDVGYYQNGS
jgi:hypothetical protein